MARAMIDGPEALTGTAQAAPEAVVVRFAGDSGDGMQLTGGQFTLSTALAGNDDFTAKPVADANQVWARHGEPLLFAKGTRGIALDVATLTLQVVDVVDGDWQGAGVLYDDPRPTYESALLGQDARARAGKSADLAKLLAKGQTWAVAG